MITFIEIEKTNKKNSVENIATTGRQNRYGKIVEQTETITPVFEVTLAQGEVFGETKQEKLVLATTLVVFDEIISDLK